MDGEETELDLLNSNSKAPSMGRCGCWGCGSSNHLVRHCPDRKTGAEASGRSNSSSGSKPSVSAGAKTTKSLAVDATPLSASFTVQQLELTLAEHRLQEEVQLLQNDSDVVTTTAATSEAIGPVMYLKVEVKGVPVDAIIDCGSQSSIISRELLHKVGHALYREGKPLPTLARPMHMFSGKGGDELVITAKTTLTVLADGKAVNVPIFVQPNSNHPCLVGTNVLP